MPGVDRTFAVDVDVMKPVRRRSAGCWSEGGGEGSGGRPEPIRGTTSGRQGAQTRVSRDVLARAARVLGRYQLERQCCARPDDTTQLRGSRWTRPSELTRIELIVLGTVATASTSMLVAPDSATVSPPGVLATPTTFPAVGVKIVAAWL